LSPKQQLFFLPADTFSRPIARLPVERNNPMKQNRAIRIIKRGQRAGVEKVAEVAKATSAEPSERELKSVVSGWVREHRQRSEEYRRSFADLLKESGFRSSRVTSLA
jgi:hypothetical protein